MHAQQLDTRIQIEGVTVTKGTSGGMVQTWAKVAEVWARRLDYSGDERSASARAGGEVAVARVEFVIRLRTDITAAMRVQHKGAAFNILHVKPLANDRGWMVLTCETGVRNA